MTNIEPNCFNYEVSDRPAPDPIPPHTVMLRMSRARAVELARDLLVAVDGVDGDRSPARAVFLRGKLSVFVDDEDEEEEAVTVMLDPVYDRS